MAAPRRYAVVVFKGKRKLLVGEFATQEEASYIAKRARHDVRNEPGARVRIVSR